MRYRLSQIAFSRLSDGEPQESTGLDKIVSLA
jgi:hypothetical protein